MKLKTIFYSMSLVLLANCNQRDEMLNPKPERSPNFRPTGFGFNKNLNMITFKDKNDVQSFVENY